MNVLCFDIGGTQLRGARFNRPREFDRVLRARSPRGDSKRLMTEIIEMAQELGKSSPFDAISIGCPGPVSATTMNGSKPLELTENINFQALLEPTFRVPIYVHNDLQMAVRAENLYGVGQQCKNFCLVSISTGIGIAAVHDGKILARRIELGHSIVETDPALAQTCAGHVGCWVAHASGTGISNSIAVLNTGTSIESFFINETSSLMERVRLYTARGLAHVIHAFDPEKIVLMGSVGLLQFDRLGPFAELLEKNSILRPIPGIECSKLGDQIGLLGAYEYAQEISCEK